MSSRFHREIIDLTPNFNRSFGRNRMQSQANNIIDLTLSDDDDNIDNDVDATMERPIAQPNEISQINSPHPSRTPNLTENNQSSSNTNSTVTRCPPSEESKAKALSSKLKVKLEFEPKGFGEANIADEVVEVHDPDYDSEEDKDSPLKSTIGSKRKANDVFDVDNSDDDGDDVKVLGGNINLASNMPHPRESCTVVAFVNPQWSSKTSKNIEYCPNCYCYVCQVKASDCNYWPAHCNANCLQGKWKKMRDSISSPLMNSFTPEQRAKYLEILGTCLPNESYDPYCSDDEDDYDYDARYTYGYQHRHQQNDSMVLLLAFKKCLEEKTYDSFVIATMLLSRLVAIPHNINAMDYFRKIDIALFQWYVNPFRSVAHWQTMKQEIAKSDRASIRRFTIISNLDKMIDNPNLLFTENISGIHLVELPVSCFVDLTERLLPKISLEHFSKVITAARLEPHVLRVLVIKCLVGEGDIRVGIVALLLGQVSFDDEILGNIQINLQTAVLALLRPPLKLHHMRYVSFLSRLVLKIFEDIDTTEKVQQYVQRWAIDDLSSFCTTLFNAISTNEAITLPQTLELRLFTILLWFTSLYSYLRLPENSKLAAVNTRDYQLSTNFLGKNVPFVAALIGNISFRLCNYFRTILPINEQAFFPGLYRALMEFSSVAMFNPASYLALDHEIVWELQRIPVIASSQSNPVMTINNTGNYYIDNFCPLFYDNMEVRPVMFETADEVFPALTECRDMQTKYADQLPLVRASVGASMRIVNFKSVLTKHNIVPDGKDLFLSLYEADKVWCRHLICALWKPVLFSTVVSTNNNEPTIVRRIDVRLHLNSLSFKALHAQLLETWDTWNVESTSEQNAHNNTENMTFFFSLTLLCIHERFIRGMYNSTIQAVLKTVIPECHRLCLQLTQLCRNDDELVRLLCTLIGLPRDIVYADIGEEIWMRVFCRMFQTEVVFVNQLAGSPGWTVPFYLRLENRKALLNMLPVTFQQFTKEKIPATSLSLDAIGWNEIQIEAWWKEAAAMLGEYILSKQEDGGMFLALAFERREPSVFWELMSRLPFSVLKICAPVKSLVFACVFRDRRGGDPAINDLACSFESKILSEIHKFYNDFLFSGEDFLIEKLSQLLACIGIMSTNYVATIVDYVKRLLSLVKAGASSQERFGGSVGRFMIKLFHLCSEEDCQTYVDAMLPILPEMVAINFVWNAMKDAQIDVRVQAVFPTEKMTPSVSCFLFVLNPNEESFRRTWRLCKDDATLRGLIINFLGQIEEKESSESYGKLSANVDIAMKGWQTIVADWQIIDFSSNKFSSDILPHWISAICYALTENDPTVSELSPVPPHHVNNLVLFITRCLLEMPTVPQSVNEVLHATFVTNPPPFLNIFQGAYMERVLSLHQLQRQHMTSSSTATAAAIVSYQPMQHPAKTIPMPLPAAPAGSASQPSLSFNIPPDAAKLLLYTFLQHIKDPQHLLFTELRSWDVLFKSAVTSSIGGLANSRRDSHTFNEKVCRLFLDEKELELSLSLMSLFSAMGMLPSFFSRFCRKENCHSFLVADEIESRLKTFQLLLKPELIHPQLSSLPVSHANNSQLLDTKQKVVETVLQKDSFLMALVKSLCWLRLSAGCVFNATEQNRHFHAIDSSIRAITQKLSEILAPLKFQAVIVSLIDLPNNLIPSPEIFWNNVSAYRASRPFVSTLGFVSSGSPFGSSRSNGYDTSLLMLELIRYFLVHADGISMYGLGHAIEILVKLRYHCASSLSKVSFQLSRLLSQLFFSKICISETVYDNLCLVGYLSATSFLSWIESKLFRTSSYIPYLREILERPLLTLILGYDPEVTKQPFQRPLGNLIKSKTLPVVSSFAKRTSISFLHRYVVWQRQKSGNGMSRLLCNDILSLALMDGDNVGMVAEDFRFSPPDLYELILHLCGLVNATGFEDVSLVLTHIVVHALEYLVVVVRPAAQVNDASVMRCVVLLESCSFVNKLRLEVLQNHLLTTRTRPVCLIPLSDGDRRMFFQKNHIWPSVSSDENFYFYWSVAFLPPKVGCTGGILVEFILSRCVLWQDIIRSAPQGDIPVTAVVDKGYNLHVPVAASKLTSAGSSVSNASEFDAIATGNNNNNNSSSSSSSAVVAAVASTSSATSSPTVTLMNPMNLVKQRLKIIFDKLLDLIRGQTMTGNMKERMSHMVPPLKSVLDLFRGANASSELRMWVQTEVNALLRGIKSKKAVVVILSPLLGK